MPLQRQLPSLLVHDFWCHVFVILAGCFQSSLPETKHLPTLQCEICLLLIVVFCEGYFIFAGGRGVFEIKGRVLQKSDAQYHPTDYPPYEDHNR